MHRCMAQLPPLSFPLPCPIHPWDLQRHGLKSRIAPKYYCRSPVALIEYEFIDEPINRRHSALFLSARPKTTFRVLLFRLSFLLRFHLQSSTIVALPLTVVCSHHSLLLLNPHSPPLFNLHPTNANQNIRFQKSLSTLPSCARCFCHRGMMFTALRQCDGFVQTNN